MHEGVPMSKQTADIIIRALLAIVAALRKEHNLPEYHDIKILVIDNSQNQGKSDILPIIK